MLQPYLGGKSVLSFISPEEQRQRAPKTQRLKGDVSADYDHRLLAVSSAKKNQQ
jgi:hypothetical protein